MDVMENEVNGRVDTREKMVFSLSGNINGFINDAALNITSWIPSLCTGTDENC